MTTQKSLADHLFGRSRRSRIRCSAARSRRGTSYRPDKVSCLDDRCLLSGLLSFAGYEWSPDYRDNLAGTGWWSSNQQFAPTNAKVIDGQLHLYVRTATVHGGGTDYTKFSSAEVDLVKKDGHDFHPGYGTYLVSAYHAGGWDALGNNNTVTFGAFTYQKDADPSQVNSHHELDMVEAGRFGPLPDGWQGTPTNAQFTLQPWNKWTASPHNNQNVNRYTLGNSPYQTFVMQWNGPNTPVTFSVYDEEIKSIAALKGKTPYYSWTTQGADNIPDGMNNQDPLIPDNGDQTVHLNLYREPSVNADPGGDNPAPPTHADEVTVTAFDYKSLNSARRGR